LFLSRLRLNLISWQINLKSSNDPKESSGQHKSCYLWAELRSVLSESGVMSRGQRSCKHCSGWRRAGPLPSAAHEPNSTSITVLSACRVQQRSVCLHWVHRHSPCCWQRLFTLTPPTNAWLDQSTLNKTLMQIQRQWRR